MQNSGTTHQSGSIQRDLLPQPETVDNGPVSGRTRSKRRGSCFKLVELVPNSKHFKANRQLMRNPCSVHYIPEMPISTPRIVSKKNESINIADREIQFKTQENPSEMKENFLKEFNSYLGFYGYPSDGLKSVIQKYAKELATYPDLLLACISGFECSDKMCDRRGTFGLNPCYPTQSAVFIKYVVNLTSEKNGPDFLEKEHFSSARTHIATILEPALPMMVGNSLFKEEIHLAKICGLDACCFLPMERAGNLSEMPINFIWFGGVLPDIYISNIEEWHNLYPNQKIILWFDERLLSADEHRAMIFLEETIPNLFVLSINNAGFDDLDDSQLSKNFNLLLDKILLYPEKGNQEGTYYVTASDLTRYALMIKQGGAINSALRARGKHEGIFDSGIIYFDTDIYASNVKGFLPDTPIDYGILHETLSWKTASSDINVLAANSNGIPLFKSILSSALDAHQNSGFLQGMRKVPDWLLSDARIKHNTMLKFLLQGSEPSFEFSSKLHFPFFNFVKDGDRSWAGGRYKVSKRTLVDRYKNNQCRKPV